MFIFDVDCVYNAGTTRNPPQRPGSTRGCRDPSGIHLVPSDSGIRTQFCAAAHVVSRANLERNNRVAARNDNENISPHLRGPGGYFPPTSLRRLIIRDGRRKPEVKR